MKVLIVVDMQNDFITGSLGTLEAQIIVPNVVKKIKEYHLNNNHLIFTSDTHDDNYLSTIEGKKLPVKHCIYGTSGWMFPRIIDRYYSSDCKLIMKDTFGSLELKEIILQLEDIDSIELVGLCTDICVISNAIILKSAFPNIPIIVDASCCAGSTPEAHKKALELMRDSLQIDVINMEK